MASSRSPCSAWAVSTRTPVFGDSAFIARVAEMPSISGIETSIRTRSGFRERWSSTASRPFPASATTSRSGSRASTTRMPARSSA